ncbi:hypothetical protein NXW48_22640 [Phocaeicola vulgatus]|nr:hypothetical protein [Phocaeicola vulgatus]
MKKIFVLVVILFTTCVPGFADDHKGEVADWHRTSCMSKAWT